MIDRHQLRASAPSPTDMVDAVRSTVSRWIGRHHGGGDGGGPGGRLMYARDDLGRPRLAGGWPGDRRMSPPSERTLPRDLDLPLRLFDPGAMRDQPAPCRATGLPDPVMLERTLHRLSVMMGR